MNRSKALLALTLATLVAGCSMFDSLNPFAHSGPKIAELQSIKATEKVHVAWKEGVGKGEVYAFSPAVVGQTVYAAGFDGKLVRIDAGTVAWTIDADQKLTAGVGADRSVVVVASKRGEILAYAAADGKLLWKAKVTSEVLAPPAVAEGLVLVRSNDNRLAAYDALDGRRKWIFQRPMPALSVRTSARPLVENQFVFSGFPGGKLIAVNLANGAAAWDGTVTQPKGANDLDRAADITSTPVVSGRLICAAAYQGRVACFDLGNGSQIWSRELSSAAGMSIDGRYLYVTDDKSAVYALDLASGASLWKQDKLYLRGVTAPVPFRGMIAVADVEGVVHFLNRDDGSFVARQTTDGSPVVAPLQVVAGQLLVQTGKGGVYAIEVE